VGDHVEARVVKTKGFQCAYNANFKWLFCSMWKQSGTEKLLGSFELINQICTIGCL
jgi:hypothetical protein